MKGSIAGHQNENLNSVEVTTQIHAVHVNHSNTCNLKKKRILSRKPHDFKLSKSVSLLKQTYNF